MTNTEPQTGELSENPDKGIVVTDASRNEGPNEETPDEETGGDDKTDSNVVPNEGIAVASVISYCEDNGTFPTLLRRKEKKQQKHKSIIMDTHFLQEIAHLIQDIAASGLKS
ncbi:hypothetical protein OUZ56_030522 [Daphnia magna]|uniref:Uncharacterized protein n=1 Tax=Daphnia magna TaxID=35525 RepID=A0ABQ9ZS08_9CRUS|nr:hypothetical protein OUZ56_030522 [Daphnia magna]